MYPIGIHFGITQIVASLAILMIQKHGKGLDTYYENSVLLIGISGLLTILPVLYLYRRDKGARLAGGLIRRTGQVQKNVANCILLLCLGAAMAQFGNLFMAIVQQFLESTSYQDTFSRIVEGKSVMEMVYWMGIVAPVAEEAVFRWLVYLRLRDYLNMPASVVISALLFGIYHGNVTQFIYAALLGLLFAYLMEMTGTLFAPVLLHIGANVWSLVYPELVVQLLDASAVWVILGVHALLFLILLGGFRYFSGKGRERGFRCV